MPKIKKTKKQIVPYDGSTLNELSMYLHQNSVEHGFWEASLRNVNVPERLALIHSEISEALEEYRNDQHQLHEIYFSGPTAKPEGFGVELIDALIRILDVCAAYGINVDETIRIKHEYNVGRPYKHGKRC